MNPVGLRPRLSAAAAARLIRDIDFRSSARSLLQTFEQLRQAFVVVLKKLSFVELTTTFGQAIEKSLPPPQKIDARFERIDTVAKYANGDLLLNKRFGFLG